MNLRKIGGRNIVKGDFLVYNNFLNLECGIEFFGFSELVNIFIDLFDVRLGEGESVSVFFFVF